MELIKILEHQILQEGRLEDAINKWGGGIVTTINSIKELSKKDPSGNNKYLDWMSRQVIENNENVNDVINVTTDFHNLIDKITPEVVRDVFSTDTISVGLRLMLSAPTDINSYPDVKTLSKVTNLAKKMLSRREVKELSKSEAETIYSDDLFEIIVPRSYQASCHYGTGTKWCVTSRDSSHHYTDYTNRGVLFFILDKRMRTRADHPLYKIAIFIADSNPNMPEIYNALDKRIAENLKGEALINVLPPQMIESIMNYFNRRTEIFSILNSQLTRNVTLTLENQEVWSQFVDATNIRVIHESSDSVLTVNIDSKKNTITFNLSNAGTTIKTIKRNLNLGVINAISSRINYDQHTIERTPEIQDMINMYFSGLINEVLPEFNKILDQIETAQILSRNKKNVITGKFAGDWVYSVVQKPTDANQVLILNVNWPEDPDEDNKLTVICYLDFSNIEFRLEGVLNIGTTERMDYDVEMSKFNPDLLSAPQRLSKTFLNWIKDKLTELLTDDDIDEQYENN